jgi:hypothetical protein
MRALHIFDTANDEVGGIIVAEVDGATVHDLTAPDSPALARLIAKDG